MMDSKMDSAKREKMPELLPCPFCGGEAEIVSSVGREDRIHYKCYCADTSCIGSYLDHWDYTPERAIEAWNTRAGRTCENISDPPEGFLCSECGWGDFAEPSHLLTTAKFCGRVHGGPNYCPNCGARRVGR